MLYLLYTLAVTGQIDTTIYELEKQLELYRLVIIAMVLLVVILGIVLLMQRAAMQKLNPAAGKGRGRKGKPGDIEMSAAAEKLPEQSELPDPGIIFRYSPPGPDPAGRIISIGRRTGSVKTWSTEILDDHLEIHIYEINNDHEKKLYELPDRLYTGYRIALKRSGNVLIHYQGLDGYRRMEPSEVIYIQHEPGTGSGPSFASIEARQPVRFRLGMELGEWDRFINGYFEFHLYVQDYETENDSGFPSIGKYFMLRLYRIYPGYDISSPDPEGIYPMLDPFSAER